MNSRKMMRTLMSAITITLDVTSALAVSDPLSGVVYPQIAQRERRQDQPHDQQPLVEFFTAHLTTYSSAKMSTHRKSTVCQ